MSAFLIDWLAPIFSLYTVHCYATSKANISMTSEQIGLILEAFELYVVSKLAHATSVLLKLAELFTFYHRLLANFPLLLANGQFG